MRPEEAGALIVKLEEQEARLVLGHFDHDVAWELGSKLMAAARSQRAPVVVDVSSGGQCLFHGAMPGSSADNDEWVKRKVRVVNRWGESSYLVGTRFAAKGTSFEASSRLSTDLFAAHGGCFPLRTVATGRLVVGTVTASGLAQADDHNMVVEALEELVSKGG